MNESNKIFDILSDIDVVQESALDTQLDVLFACDNAYGKYCTFAESYQGDVDDLAFYSEGAIGDEMKKMKGKDESAIVTILAALPRFIKAIINVITKKSEAGDKKLAELEKDKNTKKKLAKVVEVATSDEDESKHILDKLKTVLKKWCKVSVIAGIGGGLLLHFKPAHATGADGEKHDKVTTKEGIEVCINKNGEICMTEDFVNKMNKLQTASEAASTEINSGAKDSDKLVEKLKAMDAELIEMNKVFVEYDEKKAKEVGLTGIKGFIGKLKASLNDIDQAATRIGANLKSKAEEKGGIAKPAAAIVDRVLRSGTTILSKMIEYCYNIIMAIWSIISMPFAAIKELFTKNDPDHKKSEGEKAADYVEKKHAKAVNDIKNIVADAEGGSGEDPSSEEDEDAEGDDVSESSVESIPEGDSVTQESVDPTISSWYNK